MGMAWGIVGVICGVICAAIAFFGIYGIVIGFLPIIGILIGWFPAMIGGYLAFVFGLAVGPIAVFGGLLLIIGFMAYSHTDVVVLGVGGLLCAILGVFVLNKIIISYKHDKTSTTTHKYEKGEVPPEYIGKGNYLAQYERARDQIFTKDSGTKQ